jgi:hypothetical protein
VHESTETIKKQSPFTNYFKRAIDQVKVDTSGTEANSAHSPSSFKVISDVMHLYPLWAAALHGSPSRFASDADDTQRNAVLPKNRSNAPVESYFRSVKITKKQRKVRPRIFIKERLKCAVARCNEARIAFPSTRRRKGTAIDDPASAPEIWKRRVKSKSYSNKSVGLDALGSIRKNKPKKRKTPKSASSPADHVSLSPMPESPMDVSTHSEETFKTLSGPANSPNTSSNLIDEPIDFKPDQARSSTPVASALVPAELDDNVIQLIQDLLKERHPEVDGLQFAGLGVCHGNLLPKFAAADNRFVQIVNVGDHWICLTNVFGGGTHDVYVFDSLQRKTLSPTAISQISAILRNDDTSRRINIRIRKFGRQAARSRACGLFAAAAAFACCNGNDPTGLQYDEEALQHIISARLLERDTSDIPGKRRWRPTDISAYSTHKVYCACHR